MIYTLLDVFNQVSPSQEVTRSFVEHIYGKTIDEMKRAFLCYFNEVPENQQGLQEHEDWFFPLYDVFCGVLDRSTDEQRLAAFFPTIW